MLRHGSRCAYRISLSSATTLQSGKQIPVAARGSDFRGKLDSPSLPEDFAGARGATAEAKGPGTCGPGGSGVCPASAKGGSHSMRIPSILCYTAGRPGMVDDGGNVEGVAGTASGGGGGGEFCREDLPTKYS